MTAAPFADVAPEVERHHFQREAPQTLTGPAAAEVDRLWVAASYNCVSSAMTAPCPVQTGCRDRTGERLTSGAPLSPSGAGGPHSVRSELAWFGDSGSVDFGSRSTRSETYSTGARAGMRPILSDQSGTLSPVGRRAATGAAKRITGDLHDTWEGRGSPMTKVRFRTGLKNRCRTSAMPSSLLLATSMVVRARLRHSLISLVIARAETEL